MHEVGVVHGALLDTSGSKLKLSENIGIDDHGSIRIVNFKHSKLYVKECALALANGGPPFEGDMSELKLVNEFLRQT